VEVELERADDGLRDAGQQHVELPGLQSRQALLRRSVGELRLVGIVEDGDGEGATEVDEEALPFPIRVGSKEAGLRSDADPDKPALLDLVERRAGVGGNCDAEAEG